MREFRQWKAYGQVEPFGVERDDFRAAIVAATVAQAMGAKHVKFSDYMASHYIDMKPQDSVEQLAAKFKQFAVQHNRKQKKTKP